MAKLKKNISNLLKNKPELNFIIQVLSDKEIDLSLIEKFDNNEFIRQIKHHRLDSIFYKAIKEQNINLPTELQQKLEQINKQNKMRMMKLTAELIRIHKLFTENGIDYISLKGPALSQQIYGDYTIRSSRDLDILVRVEDLDKVNKVLNSIDFKTNTKNTKLCRYADKDIIYYNPKNKILLEIHHRFFINKYLLTYNKQFIINKEYSIINNEKIPILKNYVNFLYLSTHSATHNWARIVWTLDIMEYIKNLSDNEILESKKLALKNGLNTIFYQAIKMDFVNFLIITNEEQYVLLKKILFRLSLNNLQQYKFQEIICRLLTPYRVIKKNDTDKLFK